MLYALYDLQHAASIPLHIAAEATLAAFRNPFVPASYTPVGRTIAASAELTERATRRFAKPEFGLRTAVIGGAPVPVRETTVAVKPFCRLKRFERDAAPEDDRRFVPREGDPRLLIVAPLSGHHATLLRGTVEALLPNHDVYITDWVDARDVPAARGRFGLAEYIDYVMDFLRLLGPGVHVLAVCQPTVPVLAATALMAAADDPAQPVTMTLMGGPIDPRAASTEVTALAEGKPLSWFESRVVHQVPPWHAGAFRRVYPGFIQLASFMSMNADRHVDAHFKLFQQVVTGDGGSADKHRRFYDEYLAVLDLPAEFYLETVDQVFQRHLLPRGELEWRGQRVDCSRIRNTALMTVEGSEDDISAPGQTLAAQTLCSSLQPDQREHYVQPGVGHYGVFAGARWRDEICPRISAFIARHAARGSRAAA